MKRPSLLRPFACACATVTTLALLSNVPCAKAVVTIDPASDFLSSYTGPQNGDLDVLNTDVSFDGANFTLSATFNGAIGTTAGGFYVFGIDRGSNAQGFGTFAPAVLFDAVVILRPANGATAASATVTDTGTNTGTFTLPAGSFSFNGTSLTAVVPAADLPAINGISQTQFLYNLWPRSAGGNAGVSDFAPGGTNPLTATDNFITNVPEPGTMTLLGFAALALPFLVWRRRAVASA